MEYHNFLSISILMMICLFCCLDFGLSNSIKFGQKMDTNCGTPSYTCPEQIMGKKYIGSAADIWSMVK
jgi:serine/threonine protein kinase